jgi:hypothetical protein
MEKTPNIRPETMKPLEGNIGGSCNIGLGNGFLIKTPKSTGHKTKNRQMGLYVWPIQK